jgi:hypothetical protein
MANCRMCGRHAMWGDLHDECKDKKHTYLEIDVAAFLSTDEDLKHLESPMFLDVARRMLKRFEIKRR